MREIELLLKCDDYNALGVRFFGLHQTDFGNDVLINQGQLVDDIGDIAALDEELEQSDRFLRI